MGSGKLFADYLLRILEDFEKALLCIFNDFKFARSVSHEPFIGAAKA